MLSRTPTLDEVTTDLALDQLEAAVGDFYPIEDYLADSNHENCVYEVSNPMTVVTVDFDDIDATPE